MTWRLVAVACVLIAGFILNAVMVRDEWGKLPKAQQTAEVIRAKVDPLLLLTFSPKNRVDNMMAMGFDGKTARVIAKKMNQDFDRETVKRLAGVVRKQAQQLGPSLCNGGTGLPQRYAALEYLVAQDGERRRALRPDKVLEFEPQEWYIGSGSQAVYNHLEFKGPDRQPDTTLMALAAILVGHEADVLEENTPFGRGSLGSTWNQRKMHKQFPEVRVELHRYVMFMHVLAEIANKENGICDERR